MATEAWDVTEGGNLPGSFGRGGGGGGFRGGGGNGGGRLGGVLGALNDPNAPRGSSIPRVRPQLKEQQRKSRQTDLTRYLVAFLATTAEAPAWVGTAVTPKDEKADVLEFTTADGTVTRLFLDITTHLPLMMTYSGPAPRGGGGQGRQGQGGAPGRVVRRARVVQQARVERPGSGGAGRWIAAAAMRPLALVRRLRLPAVRLLPVRMRRVAGAAVVCRRPRQPWRCTSATTRSRTASRCRTTSPAKSTATSRKNSSSRASSSIRISSRILSRSPNNETDSSRTRRAVHRSALFAQNANLAQLQLVSSTRPVLASPARSSP